MSLAHRSITAAALLLLSHAACYRTQVEQFGAERDDERLLAVPSLRRIAVGSDVDPYGRISPDGLFLTTHDPATGDLALRDLRTDRTVRLTAEGEMSERGTEAYSSAISPDETLLVFGLVSMDRYPELRLMSLAGSDSGMVRTLEHADYMYVEVQGWTPDSKTAVVVVALMDRTTQILLVPVRDCGKCTARVLASFDWRFPSSLAVSPDGRWIAYDFPPSTTEAQRDVYLINAQTGENRGLVRHPAEEIVLGWTSDGAWLLFASDRAGTTGIYADAFAEGRVAGAPLLLRGDIWEASPLGTTRDGRPAYFISTGSAAVLTTTVDAVTGSLPPPTELMRTRWGSALGDIAWSPDGAHLAYISIRSWSGNAYDLLIHDVASGEVRRVPTSLAMVTNVAWFPDGGALLLRGLHASGDRGLYRLDLRSGVTSPLPLKGITGYWIVIQEEKLYYIENREDDRPSLIRSAHLSDGTRATLASGASGAKLSNLALSANGDSAAVVALTGETYSLLMVSLTNGSSRVIHAFPRGVEAQFITWANNDREVMVGTSGIVATSGLGSDLVALTAVPLDGGEPRQLGLERRGLWSAKFSPDGQRLAMMVSEYNFEAWMMDAPRIRAPVRRPISRKD